MAPSNGVRKQMVKAVADDQSSLASAVQSRSAEGATAGESSSLTNTNKSTEVNGSFISDMQSIRGLATCSICDQLLYEPWTLGCGHTYCYSCLCSWFLPNKRRKTCPDCRALVKHMPAPAFLIKQMVEILVKRTELMPVDESAEQHKQRRKEENEIVEADRIGEGGLFKGCFHTSFGNSIYFDEEDRVRRCSGCGHEYNGGPCCQNCGQDVDEEYDFSNTDDGLSMDSMDRDDLAEMELDLDDMADEDDADAEEDDIDGYPFHPWHGNPRSPHGHHIRHFHTHVLGEIRFDPSDSDGSDVDEPTQSELDFIDDNVGHEIPYNHYSPSNRASNLSQTSGSSRPIPSTEEDDDSDIQNDGRGMSNGRRRRRTRRRVPSSSPSVVTLTSTGTSEAGNVTGAPMNDRSGWSPLDDGDDDDRSVGETTADASDTDTMVGNPQFINDDDDRSRENGSSTPRYEQSPARYQGHRLDDRRRDMRSTSVLTTTSQDFGSAEDNDFDSDNESAVDREGDTDMSVSPTPSPRPPHSPRRSVETLGVAATIHEIVSDSSDDSIRAPVRRRRARRRITGRNHQEPEVHLNSNLELHRAALRDIMARGHGPQLDSLPTLQEIETDLRARPPNYRLASPRHSGEARPFGLSSVLSAQERPSRIQRQYRGFLN